ncbi:MAG: PHB depolymerase family esterase [Fimbriimonas sp.]
MRARVCLLLLIALVGVGCAQPASNTVALPVKRPGKYIETVPVGSLSRKFILRVPKAYDATKPLPLVVLLHGWTSTAARMEQYTKFAQKAEAEGFILAVPEGLGDSQGWNVGWIDLSFKKPDDVGFMTALLDQVEKEVGVDRSRVYFAGHSNGAMLAQLVGSKLGKRVAAVASVAGTVGLPGLSGKPPQTIPDPDNPVSVILLHGKKDVMVAYASDLQALLVGFGAKDTAKWWAKRIGASTEPKITNAGDMTTESFTGGRDGTEVVLVSFEEGTHDWPSTATDMIWEFFKAHPKKA